MEEEEEQEECYGGDYVATFAMQHGYNWLSLKCGF